MLKNSDILTLLFDMKEKGFNVDKEIFKTSQNSKVDLETLKFINQNRPLEIAQFYELIRKNYNDKKSKLYKNIVNEEIDLDETVITLSVLLTQILLFSKKLENGDKITFLKHSRADEISSVLNEFFINYDLTKSVKLLTLIKADLKVFESFK